MILDDFKGAMLKLEGIEKRFEEINESLSDPSILNDQNKYKSLMKEISTIEEVVYAYRTMKDHLKQYEDSELLLAEEKDSEMRAMAQLEIDELLKALDEDKSNLKMLLIPPDPLAGKNIIVEIRAGTGGDEAALFAMELYRMYCRYAELKGW